MYFAMLKGFIQLQRVISRQLTVPIRSVNESTRLCVAVTARATARPRSGLRRKASAPAASVAPQSAPHWCPLPRMPPANGKAAIPSTPGAWPNSRSRMWNRVVEQAPSFQNSFLVPGYGFSSRFHWASGVSSAVACSSRM